MQFCAIFACRAEFSHMIVSVAGRDIEDPWKFFLQQRAITFPILPPKCRWKAGKGGTSYSSGSASKLTLVKGFSGTKASRKLSR